MEVQKALQAVMVESLVGILEMRMLQPVVCSVQLQPPEPKAL